jgi:hypothetical protein
MVNIHFHGSVFGGRGVLFCTGGGGGKFSGCLRIGTNALLGQSRVGAERGELREAQRLVSTKASFASLFLATLHAAL